MNEGDRVETPDGPGVIVKIENYTRIRARYCVKLDETKQTFCYDKHELDRL